MSADAIREALADTLAQSNEGGMVCMDAHDARTLLAALTAEKARADKAEAEVERLREIVPPKVREKVMSKSAIPYHIRFATAQAIFDATRAALEKRDAD